MRHNTRLVIAAVVATAGIAAGWLTPVLAGITARGVD
jgi:hypothetical protein